MSSLDWLVIREDSNLRENVYNKPTHTNEYILYTPNVASTIEASVISALSRRAKLVSAKNDYLVEEFQYIKRLWRWMAILNFYWKINAPINSDKNQSEEIVALFLHLRQRVWRGNHTHCQKHGMMPFYQKRQTLKQKLPTPRGVRLGYVVYSVWYKSKGCSMEYVGQTGR